MNRTIPEIQTSNPLRRNRGNETSGEAPVTRREFEEHKRRLDLIASQLEQQATPASSPRSLTFAKNTHINVSNSFFF